MEQVFGGWGWSCQHHHYTLRSYLGEKERKEKKDIPTPARLYIYITNHLNIVYEPPVSLGLITQEVTGRDLLKTNVRGREWGRQ